MTTSRRSSRSRGARRGVSVIEMVVVSFLTALLSLIISSVWSAFCYPAIEVASRCRQIVEANLAAEALASDLAGYVAESGGAIGSLADGRYLGCEFPDDDPETLHIKFASLPDVVYRRDGDHLVRAVDGSGAWVIVANGLVGFGKAEAEPGDTGVAIRLAFRTAAPRSNRSVTSALYAEYILVAPAADPS